MDKLQKGKELLIGIKEIKENYKNNPFVFNILNDLIEILKDYCEIKERLEDDRR